MNLNQNKNQKNQKKKAKTSQVIDHLNELDSEGCSGIRIIGRGESSDIIENSNSNPETGLNYVPGQSTDLAVTSNSNTNVIDYNSDSNELLQQQQQQNLNGNGNQLSTRQTLHHALRDSNLNPNQKLRIGLRVLDVDIQRYYNIVHDPLKGEYGFLIRNAILRKYNKPLLFICCILIVIFTTLMMQKFEAADKYSESQSVTYPTMCEGLSFPPPFTSLVFIVLFSATVTLVLQTLYVPILKLLLRYYWKPYFVTVIVIRRYLANGLERHECMRYQKQDDSSLSSVFFGGSDGTIDYQDSSSTSLTPFILLWMYHFTVICLISIFIGCIDALQMSIKIKRTLPITGFITNGYAFFRRLRRTFDNIDLNEELEKSRIEQSRVQAQNLYMNNSTNSDSISNNINNSQQNFQIAIDNIHKS